MDIDVVSDNAGSGTSTAIGIDINASGADTNIPLKLSYDASNYANFLVASDGHFEIATTGTDGDITLDASGDLFLETRSNGYLYFKDGSAERIQFNYESGTNTIKIKAGTTAADYCTIATTADGVTTIATVDGGAADAHLNIEADGHVEFDNCAVGFDLVEPDYDATTTVVDFKAGNKQFVTFDGGNITNFSLRMPATSGNFVLVLKQDGTGSRTVTNYNVYDAGSSAANGSATVIFAGGSNPDLTDTADFTDIISFFWDTDTEILYGVATLNFDTS